MGNPLGPIRGNELPNIKDELPAPLPELRQGFRGIESSHVVKAPFMRRSIAESEPGKQSDLGREMLSATSELVRVESLHTAEQGATHKSLDVAHERAIAHSRPSESMASVSEGTKTAEIAIAEPLHTSDNSSTHVNPTLQQVGSADAAAGGAALPPPLLVATQAVKTSGRSRVSAGKAPQSQQSPRTARDQSQHAARDQSPRTARNRSTRSRQRGSQSQRPRPERSAPKTESSSLNAEVDTAREGSTIRKGLSLKPVSEEFRAELEECLDMIRWCGESLTRESLQDVKHMSRPALIVKDVLETVAMLLGNPETHWEKLTRLISTPTFLERIQKFNCQQSVSRDTFRKLRVQLQKPDFDEERIKSVCVPIVPLAMWCRAIGVYLSKTRFQGIGLEVRPVAASGAANPVLPNQVDRAPTPEAYMVFDPDIRSLSVDELKCVENLNISRPEVGSICFHGATDCTNLDFERIVRLEIGEVLVYPDSIM
jgi:hypothetical protein